MARTLRKRRRLRRRSRRSRQRGGAYRVVSSQTGRFVFDYPEAGQVSKFVSTAERYAFDQELLAHIAEVDPRREFTVQGIAIQQPLESIPADLRERLNLKEDPVNIIQYADGGPNMMTVLREVWTWSPEAVQRLFCALLRLGGHVIAMNRSGWLHGDMNLENIVYRDGVARLIDFEQKKPTPAEYHHAQADMSGAVSPLMRLKNTLQNKEKARPDGLDDFCASANLVPMAATTHKEVLAAYETIFNKALEHCDVLL